MIKKIISFITVSFVICGFFSFSIPEIKVSALSTLVEVQNKFKNREYWNHTSGASNYPGNYIANGNKTTTTACNHNLSPHKYYDSTIGDYTNCAKGTKYDSTGNCGCNHYDGAIQCEGFARKITSEIFGSSSNSWGTKFKSDITSNNYILKQGDVVRLTDPHTIFITDIKWDNAINDYMVTYGDCNGDYTSGHCVIRWGEQKPRQTIINSINRVKVSPSVNHNPFNPTPTQPGKPVVTAAPSEPGGAVTFSWDPTINTSWYDLIVYDSNNAMVIYNRGLSGNTCTVTLPSDSYTASLASVNSVNGTWTFSDTVYFTHENRPGKPVLTAVPSETDGTVTFSWDSTINTSWYDLIVYDSGNAMVIYDRGLSGNTCTVSLPSGSYTASLASVNGVYGTWTFSDTIYFTHI